MTDYDDMVLVRRDDLHIAWCVLDDRTDPRDTNTIDAAKRLFAAINGEAAVNKKATRADAGDALRDLFAPHVIDGEKYMNPAYDDGEGGFAWDALRQQLLSRWPQLKDFLAPSDWRHPDPNAPDHRPFWENEQ